MDTEQYDRENFHLHCHYNDYYLGDFKSLQSSKLLHQAWVSFYSGDILDQTDSENFSKLFNQMTDNKKEYYSTFLSGLFFKFGYIEKAIDLITKFSFDPIQLERYYKILEEDYFNCLLLQDENPQSINHLTAFPMLTQNEKIHWLISLSNKMGPLDRMSRIASLYVKHLQNQKAFPFELFQKSSLLIKKGGFCRLVNYIEEGKVSEIPLLKPSKRPRIHEASIEHPSITDQSFHIHSFLDIKTLVTLSEVSKRHNQAVFSLLLDRKRELSQELMKIEEKEESGLLLQRKDGILYDNHLVDLFFRTMPDQFPIQLLLSTEELALGIEGAAQHIFSIENISMLESKSYPLLHNTLNLVIQKGGIPFFSRHINQLLLLTQDEYKELIDIEKERKEISSISDEDARSALELTFNNKIENRLKELMILTEDLESYQKAVKQIKRLLNFLPQKNKFNFNSNLNFIMSFAEASSDEYNEIYTLNNEIVNLLSTDDEKHRFLLKMEQRIKILLTIDKGFPTEKSINQASRIINILTLSGVFSEVFYLRLFNLMLLQAHKQIIKVNIPQEFMEWKEEYYKIINSNSAEQDGLFKNYILKMKKRVNELLNENSFLFSFEESFAHAERIVSICRHNQKLSPYTFFLFQMIEKNRMFLSEEDDEFVNQWKNYLDHISLETDKEDLQESLDSLENTFNDYLSHKRDFFYKKKLVFFTEKILRIFPIKPEFQHLKNKLEIKIQKALQEIYFISHEEYEELILLLSEKSKLIQDSLAEKNFKKKLSKRIFDLISLKNDKLQTEKSIAHAKRIITLLLPPGNNHLEVTNKHMEIVEELLNAEGQEYQELSEIQQIYNKLRLDSNPQIIEKFLEQIHFKIFNLAFRPEDITNKKKTLIHLNRIIKLFSMKHFKDFEGIKLILERILKLININQNVYIEGLIWIFQDIFISGSKQMNAKENYIQEFRDRMRELIVISSNRIKTKKSLLQAKNILNILIDSPNNYETLKNDYKELINNWLAFTHKNVNKVEYEELVKLTNEYQQIIFSNDGNIKEKIASYIEKITIRVKELISLEGEREILYQKRAQAERIVNIISHDPNLKENAMYLSKLLLKRFCFLFKNDLENGY